MKTAIVTDSNSGIFPDEAAALGIWSVEMPIIVDGATRFEGRDITHEELFEAISNDIPVTTSQPAPGELEDLWRGILSSEWDSIAYIPMSAALSHSFDTAQILAAEFEGRVSVVDNRRISVTQRASVLDAISMAADGVPAAHIKSELELRASNSSVYLAVDSIEQLLKGGRTTPTAAALATVLKIKPVLTIQDEKIEPFSKERGMKKAIAKMFASSKKDAKKRFDLKNEHLIVGVACAGVEPEKEQQYLELAREEFPNAEVFYNRLPISIAVHTGPGAMGIGIHSSNRI